MNKKPGKKYDFPILDLIYPGFQIIECLFGPVTTDQSYSLMDQYGNWEGADRGIWVHS